MPIYEYKCPACDVKFELRRSFGQADDPTACPTCQRSDSKRCLSTFAAFSRGSGGTSTAVAGTGGCNCGPGCSGGNCGSCKH